MCQKCHRARSALAIFFDDTFGHGVPAVLTMLAVPPMPPPVTYPSCGKQRVVTRCHCQVAWRKRVDRQCRNGRVLSPVHVVERRAVDDDVGPRVGDRSRDGGLVGDVEGPPRMGDHIRIMERVDDRRPEPTGGAGDKHTRIQFPTPALDCKCHILVGSW